LPPQFEKLEIHQVFLNFPNFAATKNPSLSALAELLEVPFIRQTFFRKMEKLRRGFAQLFILRPALFFTPLLFLSLVKRDSQMCNGLITVQTT